MQQGLYTSFRRLTWTRWSLTWPPEVTHVNISLMSLSWKSVCDNHTSFHCSSGFTMKKWCIITFGRTNSQWETDWLWQLKLICYYAAPRVWKHRQTAVVHGVLRLLRIPFMDCVNAQHFSNDYTFCFLFFALRYTQAQSCVLPLANCGLIFVLQTNLSVWGHTHTNTKGRLLCV